MDLSASGQFVEDSKFPAGVADEPESHPASPHDFPDIVLDLPIVGIHEPWIDDAVLQCISAIIKNIDYEIGWLLRALVAMENQIRVW